MDPHPFFYGSIGLTEGREMPNIQELLSKREAALEAARKIRDQATDEDRELTEQETEQAEAYLAEAEQARQDIEAIRQLQQKQQSLFSQLEKEEEWNDSPMTFPPPRQVSSPRIVGGEGSNTFSCFGEFLHLVKRAGRDPRMAGDLERRISAVSGLGTVIDSEGGFLIAPQFSTEILRRAYETGTILSRVRKLPPLSSNEYRMPTVNETSRAAGSRYGGVRAYWVEEGGTVTATKPDFGQIVLRPKKLMVLGYVTEEQLEDAPATGSLLEQAFAEELAFTVEEAIIRGDGAGKPLGVLNAPCTVSVSKETNQTASTIWGPNIVKMWARMWARSRRDAVWLINQDVEPQLWSLALEGRYGSASGDADAVPIYREAGTVMNQGEYATLLGRPVIPVEYCSTLGTVGDIILADFSQYLVADKGSPKQAMSVHVRFIYEENTYRMSYRCDGQPWWNSALTPAQGSNTISPFVTLATRA